MKEPNQEYVDYRIKRAHDTLYDAELLIKNKSWNSAINRLYYACFYAVLAYLAKIEISTGTHAGVKAQFNLLLIKPGKLEKSMGILYADLFDFRHKGDYGDFYDYEESLVLKLLPKVQEFVLELDQLTKE